MSINQQIRTPIECPRVSASDLHWLSETELAYVYPPITGDVYHVDIDTGKSELLISFADADRYGFQWSPDGDYLLYYEGSTWIVTDTSGNVISRIQEVEYAPVWSADSSQIAYIDGTSLLTVKRDGTSLTQIFAGGFDLTPFEVLWSPDGEVVAFIGDDRLADNNQWVVGRMKPDGTELQEFSVPSYAIRVEWSPDSRWIAFTSHNDYHLYFLNLESGEVRDITSNAFMPLAWVPNSSALIYLTDDSHLAKARIGGSISVLGDSFPASAVSPDTARIAYIEGQTSTDPAPDIYIADLDGSDARVLVHNPAPTVCFNP